MTTERTRSVFRAATGRSQVEWSDSKVYEHVLGQVSMLNSYVEHSLMLFFCKQVRDWQHWRSVFQRRRVVSRELRGSLLGHKPLRG